MKFYSQTKKLEQWWNTLMKLANCIVSNDGCINCFFMGQTTSLKRQFTKIVQGVCRFKRYVKDWLVVNDLFLNYNNGQTLRSQVWCYATHWSKFKLYFVVEYIKILVKSHLQDVLYNVMIKSTMARRRSREPWKGARDKSSTLLQILVKTYSPQKGGIVDILVNTSTIYLTLFSASQKNS